MSHASDHLLDYPAEDRHEPLVDPLDPEPVPDGVEFEMLARMSRKTHRKNALATKKIAAIYKR